MSEEQLPTRVTLGRMYEDTITGFIGTAFNRTTMKNGCVSAVLMPRVGEDGKMQRAEAIYETQLIDHETRVPIASEPDPAVLALLGREYLDPKTGFQGVAHAHVEMLNDGVQIHLRARVKKNGGMGESWGIDESELVDVKTGEPLLSDAPRGPMDAPSPSWMQ